MLVAKPRSMVVSAIYAMNLSPPDFGLCSCCAVYEHEVKAVIIY